MAELPFRTPDKCDPRAKEILLAEEVEIERAWQESCKHSFDQFFDGITIECQGDVPRMFKNVGALFQREVFEAISPSLVALRNGRMPPRRRWWIERTKKASKDADLAVMVLWLTAFPVRPFYGQIAAVDRDQAKIIKDRIVHLLQFNPWLNEYVELVQNEVRSIAVSASGQPLAKFDVLAAETGGSHGATPDLLIINELSHIEKWEFVSNLMNNANGVARGMVIIATNAGVIGTPAWSWRDNAITSDAWEIHVWSQPAPWHSAESLKDASKLDTKSKYDRLWWGKWASGLGDAVPEEKIVAAFAKLTGPTPFPEPGWDYVAGLDLGVTHDHSAVCILGMNYEQHRIKVVKWVAWEPDTLMDSGTTEVDLINVEETVARLCKHYRVSTLFYDPHQCAFMKQVLERKGIRCDEMTFSKPQNLHRMASAFMQALDSEKLDCYDVDGRLRRDFGKFMLVERPFGYKLEATSDEYGHADVGTALVIALPHAMDAVGGTYILRPGDHIAFAPPEKPLTEEKIKKMNPVLRDIATMDVGRRKRNVLDD